MKFYRAHQLLELRFYRNALKRRGNRGRSPLQGTAGEGGEVKGKAEGTSTVGRESQLLRVATQRRLPLAICIDQVRVGLCACESVCAGGCVCMCVRQRKWKNGRATLDTSLCTFQT